MNPTIGNNLFLGLTPWMYGVLGTPNEGLECVIRSGKRTPLTGARRSRVASRQSPSVSGAVGRSYGLDRWRLSSKGRSSSADAAPRGKSGDHARP